MKKSEQIDRKYIDSIQVDDYEVLTDNGWEDIISLNKTIKYTIWKITTDTHKLECADTHIVFNENFDEVFVNELHVNDKIITDTGIEHIISIEQTAIDDNMFDLSLNETTNKRFYTNGILSHNSTIYCIYSLWYTTFFPEKKIMILANKAATALELLSRIATAYEYLPNWIKCTCTEFNKSSLSFGNMSVIKAFPSSSDAARGFSANCVHKNTKINVRVCKKIKFSISIGKLYKLIKLFEKYTISIKNIVNDIAKKIDYSKPLHQQIYNLYEKIIIPCVSFEVESNTGWNKITSINKTEKQKFYSIYTDSKTLLCTENHILIDENGNEVLAKDSSGKNIITKNGIKTIISATETDVVDNAYDFSLCDGTNHLYYANGILSHNCVILDEFAFLQKSVADKLFTSMYPVVSSSKNGKFILVSTPNGTGNLYYDIWCQANSNDMAKNKEGWKPFTMWWYQVPNHDEAWKEKQIAAIGKQRFAQEFNNEFLAASNIQKLIPSDILEKHRIKLYEKKVLDKKLVEGKKQSIFSEKGDKLYEFTMWHEFNPKHTYLASGDCSEGTGGDNSVLYVWDVTDLANITQCAKFSSNVVAPTEFAFITSRILKIYNYPYYICERNGIGSGYLDALSITYKYPNIVNEGRNNELGVFSHVTIKEKACIWAREMMTTQGFGWTFYDKELLSEFETFAKKDTKSARNVYAAIDPAHDDHVLAWIWCCYVLNPDLVEKYYICVKTFVSQLEKIYPKLLEPQKEYTEDQLIEVTNDPFYKAFLEFKEEIKAKLGEAAYQEHLEDKNDAFFKNVPKRDPFFGDFDDGPSWHSPDNSNYANPLNRLKPFYIC